MITTLDTNVLVYASDRSAGSRQARALDLLRRSMLSEESVLLLQALTEFSSVAGRKLKAPVSDVARLVDGWRAFLPVQPPAEEDLPAALDAVLKHGLPFWDAMLWATARRVGVQHLLSEDFQDGRQVDGVRFLNPFNAANDVVIDQILPL